MLNANLHNFGTNPKKQKKVNNLFLFWDMVSQNKKKRFTFAGGVIRSEKSLDQGTFFDTIEVLLIFSNVFHDGSKIKHWNYSLELRQKKYYQVDAHAHTRLPDARALPLDRATPSSQAKREAASRAGW